MLCKGIGELCGLSVFDFRRVWLHGAVNSLKFKANIMQLFSMIELSGISLQPKFHKNFKKPSLVRYTKFSKWFLLNENVLLFLFFCLTKNYNKSILVIENFNSGNFIANLYWWPIHKSNVLFEFFNFTKFNWIKNIVLV